MCNVFCSICYFTGFVQILGILSVWLLDYSIESITVYKCIFAQVNPHIIILVELKDTLVLGN